MAHIEHNFRNEKADKLVKWSTTLYNETDQIISKQSLRLHLRNRLLQQGWVKWDEIKKERGSRISKILKSSTQSSNHINSPFSKFNILKRRNAKFNFITWDPMKMPNFSLKRLWTQDGVIQLITYNKAFPAYFDEFKIKDVAQCYTLFDGNAIVNGLHFIIFCEGLSDTTKICAHNLKTSKSWCALQEDVNISRLSDR